MRVLIACEFSGVIRSAFRAFGHDAWSCDLLPAEDGSSKHYQCDALEVLSLDWDLMIAHPPCTYLSQAAAPVWNKPGRAEKREEALEFFMKFYNAPIRRVCVENPQGYANTKFRSADQTVHPYYFGDPHMKRTCFWLKNLPALKYEKKLPKPKPSYIAPGNGTKHYFMRSMPASQQTSKNRSRTFPSIANAMAKQWGNL